MEPEQITELINRRRRQILAHSCIYYRYNENIIDDSTFDKWCNDLVQLQNKYSELSESCEYADAFRDFDGSTGFDLPHHLPEILCKAERLLRFKNRY